MAMIKCPECGRNVSSMAKVCPDCGYPIAENSPVGEVRIKICGGLPGTVKVCNLDTEEVLWSGKAGQIARFNVNEPTNIYVTWGFGGHNKDCTANAKAGDRYSLSYKQGFFVGGYVLNQVDVIDSE